MITLSRKTQDTPSEALQRQTDIRSVALSQQAGGSMPSTAIAEPILFSEIFSIPKAEMQVVVRVKPDARVYFPPQFEVYDSQFIGGSRNRNRERKLSPGMIRFLSAVMKMGEHSVRVKWIMAEWNSVVIVGSEPAIRKLLTHEQVESYQNHLRMRSITLE